MGRKHLKTCTTIVDGIVLVFPVHLLHHILRTWMSGKMDKPVLALTAPLSANEEWCEVLSSTTLDQGMVQSRLNEAPPIRRVLFLDLLDCFTSQRRTDVDGQLSRDLVRELIVGVGRKSGDMKRQDHLTLR